MYASEVHYPRSLAELIELIGRNPGVLLYAGGTDVLREQGGRYAELSPVVALIDRIPELRQVSLTERFIEIGAAVTIAEILELKENALPWLFAEALKGIGNPGIRSLATIGGNLASRNRFMDVWSVLACLDALAEIRDGAGPRWVNVNRFADEEGRPCFPAGAVIVKIRIPLEAWEITAFRKVGPKDYPSVETAVFSLAARSEKGILSEFRLAFAGERSLRIRDLEARIVGRRLPLDERERGSIAEEYRAAAGIFAPGLGLQFGVLIDGALGLLSA